LRKAARGALRCNTLAENCDGLAVIGIRQARPGHSLSHAAHAFLVGARRHPTSHWTGTLALSVQPGEGPPGFRAGRQASGTFRPGLLALARSVDEDDFRSQRQCKFVARRRAHEPWHGGQENVKPRPGMRFLGGPLRVLIGENLQKLTFHGIGSRGRPEHEDVWP